MGRQSAGLEGAVVFLIAVCSETTRSHAREFMRNSRGGGYGSFVAVEILGDLWEQSLTETHFLSRLCCRVSHESFPPVSLARSFRSESKSNSSVSAWASCRSAFVSSPVLSRQSSKEFNRVLNAWGIRNPFQLPGKWSSTQMRLTVRTRQVVPVLFLLDTATPPRCVRRFPESHSVRNCSRGETDSPE